MKFYKIRHMPTGLFYQPVKGRFDAEKTNLSKNGKVYHKKPTLKHISHHICHSVKDESVEYWKRRSYQIKFVKSEWEIIEFTVIEKVVEE